MLHCLLLSAGRREARQVRGGEAAGDRERGLRQGEAEEAADGGVPRPDVQTPAAQQPHRGVACRCKILALLFIHVHLQSPLLFYAILFSYQFEEGGHLARNVMIFISSFLVCNCKHVRIQYMKPKKS